MPSITFKKSLKEEEEDEEEFQKMLDAAPVDSASVSASYLSFNFFFQNKKEEVN